MSNRFIEWDPSGGNWSDATDAALELVRWAKEFIPWG